MPLPPARNVLRIPRGYRSAEAASFVAQLDELTASLAADLRGLSARELEWQPAPGRNSIGMLLAHCAIVEVAWVAGPGSEETEIDFERLLGVGRDDDGMPAAPDARHPRTLRGWRLPDYLALLKRARGLVRRTAKRWTPAEFERPITRRWRSQNRIQHYNRRWILHHLLEHLAGHYGQMLLLVQLRKCGVAAPRRGKRASRR